MSGKLVEGKPAADDHHHHVTQSTIIIIIVAAADDDDSMYQNWSSPDSIVYSLRHVGDVLEVQGERNAECTQTIHLHVHHRPAAAQASTSNRSCRQGRYEVAL
jgi:hypothetical protein